MSETPETAPNVGGLIGPSPGAAPDDVSSICLFIKSRYTKISPNDKVSWYPDFDDVDLIGQNTSMGPDLKRRKVERNGRAQVGDSIWEDHEYLKAREAFRSYRRPPPPSSSGSQESSSSLAVFLLDVEPNTLGVSHCSDKAIAAKMSALCGNQAIQVMHLFGVSVSGASVCINTWGFFPFVFIECPRLCDFDANRHASAFQRHLESVVAPNSRDVTKKVIAVEVAAGHSLLEYQGDHPRQFYKVVLAHQRLISSTKSVIESGIQFEGSDGRAYKCPDRAYEANIPVSLMFMVARNLVGCGWLEVPVKKGKAMTVDSRSSRCQIEVDVEFTDLRPHAPGGGEWHSIPKDLRVLSFDIECMTVSGSGFPVAQKDPVIQISSVMSSPGKSEPRFKAIFTLDECAPIAGTAVFSFADERAMLSAWREMVIHCDPDILTGFNFINFDLNYLLERAKTLGVSNFMFMSRMHQKEAKIRDAVLSTRALGTHENKDINVEGRVQFDVLELLRREYKLKSYTLNAVSAHFLKEQKEDVHYSQIGILQRGSPETRKRVALYCIKDAVLPLRLIEKLLLLINNVEMARVTGVPLSFLLTRGQQIKVTSQLLRKCREMSYFMPTVAIYRGGDDRVAAYEGATVLEAMKGFYETPIATLDFASLYPSIMIAHNLCYSTLVPENQLNSLGLAPEDLIHTPSGSHFVKDSKRKGLLPLVVNDLLTARKAAKREMSSTKDPFLKMVLNGRQLALKISANSVYGYTGATAGGQLPCLEISMSITAYGRQMIDFTKQCIEDIYKQPRTQDVDENDDAYIRSDAIVVYGDTDSVMVDFGTKSLKKTMELGGKAASMMSQKFRKPISLEFEKVFYPFLLMNKKRYAGLVWTSPEKYDKLDCKGIETVRRDFCLLVQKMVDETLNKILIDRDRAGAVKLAQSRLADLLQNKIDLSDLVLSKSLGKDDYAAKLAHVELAKKLRKRDPATAPQIGDRVFYVIVAGAKGEPQYDRAEDPIYVLENNIPIDIDFYIDSIKNPLKRIFEGVMEDPESLFHIVQTLPKRLQMSTSGALSKFVKTSIRCLGCRSVIKQGYCCDHCKATPRHAEIVGERFKEFREKETDFGQLWVECQRCQGSLHQDVICTSRDCPIYYRRIKIRKEIEDVTREISLVMEDLDW